MTNSMEKRNLCVIDILLHLFTTDIHGFDSIPVLT